MLFLVLIQVSLHIIPSFAATPMSFTTGSSPNSISFSNTGSGTFTSYNFQRGMSYKVYFRVRNNDALYLNSLGALCVYAAKYMAGSLTNPPSVSCQKIEQTYCGPASQISSRSIRKNEWQFVNATFIPNDNYNSLWFCPANPMRAPISRLMQYNAQYPIEVEQIKVVPIPSEYNVSVSSNPFNTAKICNGQTVLQINGMPAGTVATWTPSATLSSPKADGSIVIAHPAETTTYKIEISDPSSYCRNCVQKVLYYTVDITSLPSAISPLYTTKIVSSIPTILHANLKNSTHKLCALKPIPAIKNLSL